jgi:uncharacterized OB-fold protein
MTRKGNVLHTCENCAMSYFYTLVVCPYCLTTRTQEFRAAVQEETRTYLMRYEHLKRLYGASRPHGSTMHNDSRG